MKINGITKTANLSTLASELARAFIDSEAAKLAASESADFSIRKASQFWEALQPLLAEAVFSRDLTAEIFEIVEGLPKALGKKLLAARSEDGAHKLRAVFKKSKAAGWLPSPLYFGKESGAAIIAALENPFLKREKAEKTESEWLLAKAKAIQTLAANRGQVYLPQDVIDFADTLAAKLTALAGKRRQISGDEAENTAVAE